MAILNHEIVIIACVLANAAGVGCAALVAQRGAHPQGPRLLSVAVGVLVGAVLLEVLPRLWESTGNPAMTFGLFGAAMLASVLFARMCICRHRAACGHKAGVDHRGCTTAVPVARGAEVLVAGDFVHSLVDWALIAAAFAVGLVPGAVATMAVAMHELPRRIGTMPPLVRVGYRPASAPALAVCTGMGTVLGGVMAWLSAEAIRPALPIAFALSTAAMLYVALAQSALLFGAWRGQVAMIACGLPFLAGILIVEGSHHLLELVA